MKAAFKWRLQNGIYGYLIDEDNQNGPFAYDISNSSRIYPDGTIETGTTVNEGEISATVSKFSRDEYINAFNSFKSFINASYPQVSLLDVMYYYNIENDECTASASSLKCSATDIIFDATAVDGDELSVVVTNEQTDPNTGEALRYRLDFTFPNTAPSGGTVVYSSVTSGVIISSSITSETITANELTVNNINTENITSITIATSAITTSSITTNEFNTTNINTENITSTTIATSTITSSSITTNNVVSDSITGLTVAASAITTSSITSNSFVKNGGTSDQYLMADGSVTTLTAGTNVTITKDSATGVVTISSQGGGSDYYQGRNVTIDSSNKINAEGYTFDSGVTSVSLFNTSDTGLKYTGPYGGDSNSITVNDNPTGKVVVGDKLIINGGEYEVSGINSGPFYIRFTTEFNSDGVTTETKVYKIQNSNVASAERSFAAGTGTVAYKTNMTVVGEYNDLENDANKSDILFAVGNGTSTQRSNAFIVRKDGSIHIHSTEDQISGEHYGGRIDFGNGYNNQKANVYIEETTDNELRFKAYNFSFRPDNLSVSIDGDANVTATVNNVPGVYLGCPIGTIVMWPGLIDPQNGSYPPYGWLLCDGSTLNNSGGEYNNLYYVIGTNYGGTGQASFNLPNLQQKFPLGALSGGTIGKQGTGDTVTGWSTSLAATGGTSGQTLSINEMPSHNHSLNDFRILTDDSDGITGYNSGCINANTSSAGRSYKQFAANGPTNSKSVGDVTVNTLSTNFQGATIFELNNTGSSKPHNNIPPFIAINFIIKYK